GQCETYTASHLLVALPLALLQAPPELRGAVRFSPELPAGKQDALGRLAMGKVIRVTLCFRERFWVSLRARSGSESKTLADMRFFAGEGTDFTGHQGTVHGAIASGHRAAAGILKA